MVYSYNIIVYGNGHSNSTLDKIRNLTELYTQSQNIALTRCLGACPPALTASCRISQQDISWHLSSYAARMYNLTKARVTSCACERHLCMLYDLLELAISLLDSLLVWV